MKYKLKKQYRLEGYDYSQNGSYFVTICTNKFNNFFGEVINRKIELSDVGKIAQNYWLEIPLSFNNVITDEFIVMPNHVHGILMIDNDCKNTLRRVPTGIHSLTKNSISSIINHYKGNVKRFCNKNNMEYFAWQPRFYDHIIRDERSLNNIRKYILNNPLNWETDNNNIENLSI